MTFHLIPDSGEDIWINAWHWRPTMLLVRAALNLDEERFEGLQGPLGDTTVTAAEANQIADYLDAYLATFAKDSRLLLDGSVTQEPKGPLGFEDGDWDRHYSANYDWLVRFRDFCRSSGGFEVV